MKKHPTKKRLRELFRYRRDGNLIRLTDRGGEKAGSVIGCPDGHGYKRAGVDGEDYQVHRLIWIWHYGSCPDFLDHKNKRKSSNRIGNLRRATKTHNEWHKPKRRHNTTGYKNVYRVKGVSPSPFWAYITVNGKRKGLGMFKTALAAYRVYRREAKKLHGEFFYER